MVNKAGNLWVKYEKTGAKLSVPTVKQHLYYELSARRKSQICWGNSNKTLDLFVHHIIHHPSPGHCHLLLFRVTGSASAYPRGHGARGKNTPVTLLSLWDCLLTSEWLWLITAAGVCGPSYKGLVWNTCDCDMNITIWKSKVLCLHLKTAIMASTSQEGHLKPFWAARGSNTQLIVFNQESCGAEETKWHQDANTFRWPASTLSRGVVNKSARSLWMVKNT